MTWIGVGVVVVACIWLAAWLASRHERRLASSQWAWRELASLPDPEEMFHADGRNRRARVTRFPEPDASKLRMLKRKADIVRIDSRRAQS